MLLIPILNKIYVFKAYTLLILKSGEGMIQVDFRNYYFTQGKAIFLSPHQYFQLLTGSFEITTVEFPEKTINQISNSRYLFKHLVSLGHIDITQPKTYYLNQISVLDVSSTNHEVLIKSIEEWKEENPFNASTEEVNLLFDLKDFIDEKYREPISLVDVSKTLNQKSYRIKLLTKEKLDETVNKLTSKKILLEAQRKIIFTDQSTKEIAYDLGFKDPTYFNRFFKLQTDTTPQAFRNNYDFNERDTFLTELTHLIDTHFKDTREPKFYADKLFMSVRTLSSKVHQRLGITITELIQQKIIATSKKMMQQHIPIIEIAFELGFSEPNNFSTFFKTHTGETPTQFLSHF